MLKNQSIKSFFTSAANKKTDEPKKEAQKSAKESEKKIDDELMEIKDESKEPEKSKEKPKEKNQKDKNDDLIEIKDDVKETENKSTMKTPAKEKANLNQKRKTPAKSPATKSTKSTTTPGKNKTAAKKLDKMSSKADKDDEKENILNNSLYDNESSDIELVDESEETKKKKSPSSKRRKVIESSSNSASSSEEKEEEEKPKKKPAAKKATKKAAKKSKVLSESESEHSEEKMVLSASSDDEKDTKKESSKETKTSAGKKSPKRNTIKSESENEEVVVEKRKKSVSVEAKKETETVTVKEETVSKSTSNFFNIKKASASTTTSAAATCSYAPNKENYHPIKDAFWAKGEAVPYKAFAQTLYCMEKTTKRLELLSIVCNYFRSVLALSPKDLIPSVYMLTNRVAPDYESIELGIGDTVLFKALAEATGATVAKLKLEFQAKGDLGLVAEANRSNQKLIMMPKKLTIGHVFNKLKEIAAISGNASQTKKCDLIKGLFVSCDAIEARYLIRSLSGKLRNGLGEQSILVSLANACSITPPVLTKDGEQIIDKYEKMRKNPDKADELKKLLDDNAKIVKRAYYQCPNYEIVIGAIISHGLDNLEEYCKLTPGVPLKPMLANPTKGIQEILKRFENIEFTCEYKYDGERGQIHILEDGSVKVYSRNSENNTGKYPDVIETLKELLHLGKRDAEVENRVVTAIIDAEIVAYDIEKKLIQPFQVLSTRKRKDAASEEIKVKVCIFGFDLIYLNGESLIDEPFRKRRDLLYKYFPKTEGRLMFAEKMDANDVDKIQEFLDKSIKDGCEGLMIKTLDDDAHYEISKRSYNWLKLKKDYLEGVGDTLDLVVIGGYLGTGKRTGVYGGYLLACYDPENEEYQTICKLGTGLKDNDLEVAHESLSKIKIDKPKSYYRFTSGLEVPDVWFEAEQVWEIKCADFSLSPVHTAAIGLVDDGRGVSMRFPRFLRLRDDKKPEQSTSSEQICDMYKNQQQQLNQNQKSSTTKSDNEDDDNDEE